MLVGAPRKGAGIRYQLEEQLDELAALADTAGASVVGRLTQFLDRPNPATFLGTGKLDALREEMARTNASLAIFDDELSPAQGRNIELALDTRVMDRAELILDIFATRARTSEAKMQVELAQLEYMLPRLTRMWTHLEKFRGGIGMRGPGETQLETDRRLISRRIKVLRSRLGEVQRSRAVQRQGRRETFRVSLVGYTNAGKSSILRALAGANDVLVENRLFATLDPLTREVVLDDGMSVLVTDTVGFIRKLPHDLVASFRATLEEVREADLLLHVIDLSHPVWEEQMRVVDQVLGELSVREKPVLYVFNKIDQLDDATLLALPARVAASLPNSVFVSATGDGGLEPLRRALLSATRTAQVVAEVRVSASNGKALAQIHQMGTVLDQRSEDSVMVVTARLTNPGVGRLRSLGADVKIAS